MKKIFLLLSLCFVFIGQAIAQDAPTPREIGDAYIEMTGGVDAWKAVASTRIKGKAAMQGMEFPMTMTNAKGDAVCYAELARGGTILLKNIEGID